MTISTILRAVRDLAHGGHGVGHGAAAVVAATLACAASLRACSALSALLRTQRVSSSMLAALACRLSFWRSGALSQQAAAVANGARRRRARAVMAWRTSPITAERPCCISFHRGQQAGGAGVAQAHQGAEVATGDAVHDLGGLCQATAPNWRLSTRTDQLDTLMDSASISTGASTLAAKPRWTRRWVWRWVVQLGLGGFLLAGQVGLKQLLSGLHGLGGPAHVTALALDEDVSHFARGLLVGLEGG